MKTTLFEYTHLFDWVVDQPPNQTHMCLYHRYLKEAIYVRKGLYREHSGNCWIISDSLDEYKPEYARVYRRFRFYNFFLSKKIRFLLDVRQGIKHRQKQREIFKKKCEKILIQAKKVGTWTSYDGRKLYSETSSGSEEIDIGTKESMYSHYSDDALQIRYDFSLDYNPIDIEMELPESAHERLEILKK